MVDKTNGIGPLNQQFSSKGVRLAALKKDNELLFNYFKKAGFDENSMIYSTDIEKLKKIIWSALACMSVSYTHLTLPTN